ncbi:Hypothetical protein DEACI_0266 [Acididesulfobacillus acetoxydans]|uniref:Uncharacterized protein n=1 Tax=Acididesulfobacillus acetoxydans TaxID=1561005 RepID=A0A8S0X2Z7_9FIRM|nr:hypothetical protein [Acididesulfobacillus acetoxydans]CAA7599640.1 Hypothetical protein DEACI_0266 [Acididesulfobacillus acetoxydans]CEJ06192.1 Hypothetical protein DEACI_0638 [Acididesulfobacillus acetoxydans]
MDFDQRKVVTLVGTLVLAGAVIAAGVYGPSAWKVLRSQSPKAAGDQVLIQNPPINGGGSAAGAAAGQGTQSAPNVQAPGNSNSGTSQQGTPGQSSPTATAPSADPNTQPQGDASGPRKYVAPDLKLIDLAPSIAGFFDPNNGGLSQTAETKAFSACWDIHQYVDGYLYGPTAGPQMNAQDIKKYIIFFKTVWDSQLKKEPGAAKAAVFCNYMDEMFNRGIDAFNSQDKVRIEEFHQEIHDMDEHLFRNNTNAKVYGATPFATKR